MLPSASAVADGDLLLVSQLGGGAPASRRATVAQLREQVFTPELQQVAAEAGAIAAEAYVTVAVENAAGAAGASAGAAAGAVSGNEAGIISGSAAGAVAAQAYVNTEVTNAASAAGATAGAAAGASAAAGVVMPARRVRAATTEPLGELRNDFLHSEDLGNAAWTRTRMNVSVNASLDPDGAPTADRLIPTTNANTSHFVGQAVTVTEGVRFNVSFCAKAAGYRYIRVALPFSVGADNAVLDAQTGVISPKDPGMTASSVDLGGGWFRFTISSVPTQSGATNFQWWINQTAVIGGETWTANGIDGIDFWGFQAWSGEDTPSYILTTTAVISGLVGPSSVDGVALSPTDRVLVKDAASPTLNGIYLAGSPGALMLRAGGFDTAEILAGSLVVVDAGSAFGGSVYACRLTSTATLGVDPVLFEPLSITQSGVNDAVELAMPAIVRGLLGRSIDEFGVVDRDGLTNTASLFNDAFAQSAIYGDPLVTGPGNYLQTASITIPSNLHALFSKRATLIHGFAGNHIITSGIASHVNWVGGRVWNPNVEHTGNVFLVQLDDSDFGGFFIDEWEGRAIFLTAGSRNRFHNFRAVSVRDGGGIRLQNCSETIVENGYVTCGDDCLMFSAPATSGYTPADATTTINSQYVNMIAYSWNARVCTAIQQRTSIEEIGYNRIRDCGWIGVRGRGKSAIAILNTNSYNEVANIRAVGVHVAATSGALAAVTINNKLSGTLRGPIEDISLEGCSFTGFSGNTLVVTGNPKKVVASKSLFGSSSTAGVATVSIGGDAEVALENCTVQCRADAPGLLIGNSTGDLPSLKMSGGAIEGVGASQFGADLVRSRRVLLEEIRFSELPGATSARAINVRATAQKVKVGRNDYDLTSAEKVSLATGVTNGVTIENRQKLNITAAVTLGAHESGTEVIHTGSAAATVSLPPARRGLHFRLIQGGSGLLTIQANGSDVLLLGAASSASLTTRGAGGGFVLVASEDGAWVVVAVSAGALSVPAILHDLPGKPLGEFSAALDREGVQPMSDLLNDCIQQYISEGNPVAIGAGNYRLNKTLIARTDMHLIMSSRARLVADIGVATAITHPVGTTEGDPATWPRNVLIRGGILARPGTLIEDAHGTGFIPATPSSSGHMIRLFGWDYLIDHVSIIGYLGRGMLLAGRDGRVVHPYLRHPQRRRDTGVQGTASGGIRVLSGTNIWVYGSDVHAGDDGLQIVTSLNTGVNATGSGFIGGTVRSDGNAGLAVKLVQGVPGQVMRDLLFADITAYGDGKTLSIENFGDGSIDNIVVDSVNLVDLRNDIALHGVGAVTTIRAKAGGPDALGIGLVRLRAVSMGRNLNGAMSVLGNVGRIEAEGCRFERPVSGTASTIRAIGTAELVLDKAEVEGGNDAASVIAMGGRARSQAVTYYDDDGTPFVVTYDSPGQVRSATLKGVTVSGLAAGQRAVDMNNVAGGAVIGLRPIAAVAGSAVDGLRLGRNASNIRVDDLDAQDITGLPYLDEGRLNVLGRIIGASVGGAATEMVGRRRLDVNATAARAHTPTTALAWAYSAAGDLALVGQNAARWTSARHLMVSDARTVTNINPIGAAGVAGTLTGGSPTGALPTNWSTSFQSGVNVELLGYENFGSVPLPVFRIYGTGNGSTNTINFMTAATATAGETWTATMYAALIEGDKSALSTMVSRLGFVGGSAFTASALAGLSDDIGPVSVTATAAGATTGARGRLDFTVPNATTFDVTLALAGFLEKAAWHSTPIVPLLGGTGSVTRGRDIVTQALTGAGANAGYVSGAVVLPRAPVGYDAGIFVLDNGTDNNRLSLLVPDGTTDVVLRSISGGSEQFATTIGAAVPGEALRFAIAYDRTGGVARCAITGSDVVQTVTGTMPSSGFTQIGAGRASNTGTAATLNGEIIGMSFSDNGEIANNTLLSLVAG